MQSDTVGTPDYVLPAPSADARSPGERIRQFVRERIESGSWPTGYRVPSETELASRFQVARMTVHSALRELADAGLLVRRPGAGTRVASPRPPATLLEVRNVRDEIVARGHRHCAVVHALEALACDLATATELEVAPGTELFRSVIVHHEDGRPVQLESRVVAPAFAPDYLRQDYGQSTPYDYLMSLGPLEEVEHIVQAVMPDAATRGLLALPKGEPVLQMRRRTWSGGRVVTSARLIHPGNGYSLIGRFRVGDARR